MVVRVKLQPCVGHEVTQRRAPSGNEQSGFRTRSFLTSQAPGALVETHPLMRRAFTSWECVATKARRVLKSPLRQPAERPTANT